MRPDGVETAAIAACGAPGAAIGSSRLAAYIELTKPRLTALILLVSAAAYWMASGGGFDAPGFLGAIAGVGLLACGIFSLNQYIERDVDAAMRRTAGRPLPTGRLSAGDALSFGCALTGLGVVALALLANVLSGALAVFTAASYLFLYTPLKTRTPHSTLLSAFPGAMPPLLGWAAARGEIGVEACSLYLILFLWQFPHFHSIGWLYSDDYARAGIRVWPVVEPEGRITAGQILAFTALLVPASLAPAALGMSGVVYVCGALAVGIPFLVLGVRSARRKSKWQARRLLVASVLYLPALFALMLVDRW